MQEHCTRRARSVLLGGRRALYSDWPACMAPALSLYLAFLTYQTKGALVSSALRRPTPRATLIPTPGGR